MTWCAVKRFMRDDSASAAVAFGLGALVAFGFATLTFDGSYLDPMHGRLENATDPAPHAAAGGLPAEGAARTLAPKGQALGLPFGRTQDARKTDVGAGGVETAQVRWARDWDLIIVQDVTDSFRQEIDEARAADQALLNCVRDSGAPGARVGITVFTGVGQTWSPVQDADDGYATLSTDISRIRTCDNPGMPECAGTHIAAGIKTSRAVFSSLSPRTGAKRGIVIVTDGAPNPTSRGPAAIAAADYAWAEGLHIFTVFYDRNQNASERAFVAGLARGDGVALSTRDPAKLPDLLARICSQVVSRHLALAD